MNANRVKSSNAKTQPRRCIACMEIIQPGAKICPQCRSYQSHQRLRALGTLFKWIGGATAIITLVIGVTQLNNILKEWRDRRVAVKQFVEAARMQMELREYPGAWLLVRQGLAISPESHIALDQEVDVAMAWLRDIWRHKGKKTVTEIVDPLMPVLFRGVFSEDAQRSADVIAHIGWANLLRTINTKSSHEIDEYFRRAIEQDPQNTYAHLFWGYWILHWRNDIKYKGDRLEIAINHFAAALKTRRDRQHVNSRCLWALSHSNVKGADIEAIKMANDLRKNDEQAETWGKVGSVELFRRVPWTQFREGKFLHRLFKHVSPEDILATYVWLSEDIDFDHEHPRGMPSENHKFVIALLTEASGNLESALEQYILLWRDSDQIAVERAIDRVKTAMEKK